MLTIQQYCKAKSLDEAYELLQKNRMNQIIAGMLWLRMHLDYRRQHQFLQEMLRLKLQGRSMLISMHDPNLALQYADELVLLHQGKLYAHIRGPRPEMTAACCTYYNELYGDTFTVIGTKSEPTLIWKENNYADDSAILQGKEPR